MYCSLFSVPVTSVENGILTFARTDERCLPQDNAAGENCIRASALTGIGGIQEEGVLA